MLSELGVILARTKAILKDHYQTPILFEHGLASGNQRAGACVDHAHMHLVAVNVDITSLVVQTFPCKELAHWTELRAWQGKPYLLVQNTDERPMVADVPNNLPSQFLRREIAAALKVPDRWDWGAYLGLNEIYSTVDKIKRSFEIG
jgi:hypothetical protein